MEYLKGVMSRLDPLGAAALFAGCILTFTSGKTAEKFFPDKQETVSLIIKAAGCLIAAAGALVLLDIIG